MSRTVASSNTNKDGSDTKKDSRRIAQDDQELNNALKMTFPASDAVAVGPGSSGEPLRPSHRQAPRFDRALVERLARVVAKRRSSAS